MKKYLFLFLLAFATLGACKSSKDGTKVAAGVPEDFALEIYHQGCRGSCPDYRIKVDSKGNATYVGRRAVEMMGNYQKTLTGKTVKELYEAIVDYKFFDFEEVYGGEVADLPEIHTTVTMNGKTHRVRDVRNAPTQLKELEAKLETLIGKTGWERVE